MKNKALPEVGIFWIDGGTMFAEGVSLRDAEDYGEFKTFSGSHYEFWAKAVLANPKWNGKAYEEIPRGRVVYKEPMFIVYLPKRILKCKGKIIARFNLPKKHTRFDTTDEHYAI